MQKPTQDGLMVGDRVKLLGELPKKIGEVMALAPTQGYVLVEWKNGETLNGEVISRVVPSNLGLI